MDLTLLGKTPIQADAPSGADMRYDADFDALQTEIDKLTSPTATTPVDWVHVAEGAARILETKSKDLTVASYLAVALVCTRQVSGLDQGVLILKEMLETFWDTLYPPKKRMRGRAGAITWWLERTELELQKSTPAPMPLKMAERLKANLRAIDAWLAEKMPDAPLLRGLQRRVEALPVEAAQEPAGQSPAAVVAAPPDVAEPETAGMPSIAPAHGATAKNPAPARAHAAAAADAGGTITDAAEARRAADNALQRLRQISLFLLQQDLRDPLAYRYRRMAAWARVVTLPVHAEGTTQIAPPAPQVVDQLEALSAAATGPALIQMAEQKLSQSIFWLDLNRWVAEALKDLSPDHQAAMNAVCQDTAALLQRLPELAAMRFSDGMPFADPATRRWLQQIGAGEGDAPSAADTGGSAPDPMLSIVQKADGLARKKQVIEAVDLLQQQMLRSRSHRDRMGWRVAIARLLLETKKASKALPHLEQILNDIDRFDLAQWDPHLAVEGLTLAWQGFSAQTAGDYKARAEQVLHRMAKLDPTAALRAEP
jgi:type VI secretion system protein VasJ